ncbi:MAG: hypothetical protein DSZ28_03440 [Thiothrix sp.]|nr:MAG: hypothetical protein DSZ28_03440 [Thiothrix sp.]
MALTHNINLVAANRTLCQNLNCGGAANRMRIKISSKKTVPAYFATYVDDNHHFRGRCTWGNGGFGFEVWLVNSGGVPTVRFKVPNSSIGLNFADDALEKFFNHLNKILVKKLEKTKGGGRFKAPQVEAHKYKPYNLQTTQKRVDSWVEKGEFDLAFGNFIKKHVDHGLRCKGQ